MSSPLYFIDNGGVTDARRNLALEEICLRRLDMNRGMYLLFYVNEPAIIIGRNQNTIEEIDAEYSGDALEIGFNARYILDMLQEIDGEKVRFEMASAAAPTVVRDPGDGSTLYVLMPMRV